MCLPPTVSACASGPSGCRAQVPSESWPRRRAPGARPPVAARPKGPLRPAVAPASPQGRTAFVRPGGVVQPVFSCLADVLYLSFNGFQPRRRARIESRRLFPCFPQPVGHHPGEHLRSRTCLQQAFEAVRSLALDLLLPHADPRGRGGTGGMGLDNVPRRHTIARSGTQVNANSRHADRRWH